MEGSRFLINDAGFIEEDPLWMRRTRLQRLLRPLARVANVFQDEPARDGAWPLRSDGSVILGSEAMSTYSGIGDGPAIGEMAAQDLANDPNGDYDVG